VTTEASTIPSTTSTTTTTTTLTTKPITATNEKYK
jgi:hypothetical protein